MVEGSWWGPVIGPLAITRASVWQLGSRR
ncbi:hypothetical protein LINPERPRIM_LOCUS16447 [Linum perenne]